MITVRYRGRLGNNLFQYALGRLLAEHHGLTLNAVPLHGFPRTCEKITGDNYDKPKCIHSGNFFDIESHFNDLSPRHTILNGYFQHHAWCWPRRNFLRDLYPLNFLSIDGRQPEKIVVNVRRTDYVMLDWALPFSFYRNAIELSGASDVWIVTDDKRDPFFHHFRPYKPRFFSAKPIEQLRFMAAFEKIVLSPSTFSWWPVLLGNATQAFTPQAQYGCWSGQSIDGPNLIPDDPLFQTVPVHESYQPTPIEAKHQNIRRIKKRIRQKLGLNWTP